MIRSLLRAGLAPLCALVAGCAQHLPPGPVSVAALHHHAPAFAQVATVSAAERAHVAAAIAKHAPLELNVYFADWCHDSVRELPRLLALIDGIPSSQLQLQLINLDHNKTDPAGLARAAGITRTPTVVVRRQGQELGRIIERPARGFSTELLDLLSRGD